MATRRYTITKLNHRNWVRITDSKTQATFIMTLKDFGKWHTELPAYCKETAISLWENSTK